MKKFVSFRITALAFVAAFVTQVTCAYASISFLGVAAGDATTDDATVWTRAKDEVSPGPTALNVQISTDPNFMSGVTTLPAGTANAPPDYTSRPTLAACSQQPFTITSSDTSRLCAESAQVCAVTNLRVETANQSICTNRAELRSSTVRFCPTTFFCPQPLLCARR